MKKKFLISFVIVLFTLISNVYSLTPADIVDSQMPFDNEVNCPSYTKPANTLEYQPTKIVATIKPSLGLTYVDYFIEEQLINRYILFTNFTGFNWFAVDTKIHFPYVDLYYNTFSIPSTGVVSKYIVQSHHKYPCIDNLQLQRCQIPVGVINLIDYVSTGISAGWIIRGTPPVEGGPSNANYLIPFVSQNVPCGP